MPNPIATPSPAILASLAVGLSLITYATITSYPSLTTFFPSSSSSASSSDTDSEDKKQKLYQVRRENYSPATGSWEIQDENATPRSEGLFTVKHRVWPKSADYEGDTDYTAIEVHSRPLVAVLRLELKEVEQAFEDEPELDAQDIFLHLDGLRRVLQLKKDELVTLKAKQNEKKENPAEVEKAEENAEPEEDVDSERTGGAPAVPQTVAEIEKEISDLEVLLKYIDEFFAPTKAKLDRLLAKDVVSFNLLWAIFSPGSLVEGVDDVSGEKYAFKLKTCSYDMSRDGLAFQIMGTRSSLFFYFYPVPALIKPVVRCPQAHLDRHQIRPKLVNTENSQGMRKISSLPVHPLDEKRREELTTRGRLYTGLARVAFMSYSGSLIQILGSGCERKIIKLRAEGRAVVDVNGFKRLNPSMVAADWTEWVVMLPPFFVFVLIGLRFVSSDEDDVDFGIDEDSAGYDRHLWSTAPGDKVRESELCLLPPTVFGFSLVPSINLRRSKNHSPLHVVSLVQREWGQMRVDQFSEVVFNDNAYDYLVMDPDQKDLIKSLVAQNSKASLERAAEIQEVGQVTAKADFVAGKGGGLVVALHGRPGTGKTLTAEAIAELLHVPLYAVGAGELGDNADILEKRLRDILDVGNSWGAVLLVDEADVFLEQRSLHDVQRNAMYSSGILLMTTNRIRTVDPAFLSRFSIAITYPDLSSSKRRTIWTTFLTRAGARIEESKSRKKALPNGVVVQLPTPSSSGNSTPTEEGGAELGAVISAKYLDRLAMKAFNGRSIKNTVRTASALAMSKGVPLSEVHLDIVVKVSETFLADVQEPDEDGVYDAAGEGWKSRVSVYS
ncbi:hypothetical protein P7C70_g6631, partial [Phenoliferia sp. Uapishka_3]